MADPLLAQTNLDQQNLETAEKIFNVQKDITVELQKRERMLETLNGLDSNIEKSIHRQLTYASKYNEQLMKAHKDLASYLEELDVVTANKDKGNIDRLNHQIKSEEERIAKIGKQRDLVKMMYEYEFSILEEIQKKHEFANKQMLDGLGIKFKEIDAYKNISKQIGEIFPKMKLGNVMMLAGLLVLLNAARDIYESFEKQAAAFRRFAGMFRETAKPMRVMAEDIAIQFAHVGVTIEGVYNSFKALGTEMGGFHNVTKDLVLQTSLLSSQLGVSEENTAGMLRNLAVASKSTMQAQKSMAYFAADISSAAGVPLNLVMGDIAKMSGTAFAMMNKMPLAMIKAAVEARRLNTTINDMARASESILDFQNSVNAEMEASVLLGQSINLQRARYLAYNKDIVGSTKEILRIAKNIDFQNLDVFQMQAFARATGRSVEELAKMLQAEKQMDDIRASTDPKVQAQLQAYERMKAANEATANDAAKNLETIITQRANQERMVALQNQWNKLLMEASRVFLPVLDIALQLAGVFVSLFQYTSLLVGPLGKFIQGLVFAKNMSLTISMAFGSISKTMLFLKGVLSAVYTSIGWVGKLMGTFGKFLGPIGLIITAFQLIWSSIKHIRAFLKGEESFGTALWGIVYDVLLKPFVEAWEWIKGIFVGRSPSTLAMGIVKGIVSAQQMILDALMWPIRKAASFLPDFLKPAFLKTAPQTPEATLSGKEKSAGAPAEEAAKSPANQTLNEILLAIRILNNNLESGKIGVYIDGSLVSSTLARKLEFKGSFGMNT